MTTNDSTPNVPTPIDPASRIALAVLAMLFDERHAARDELAEECRNADDSMYPEQKVIADTWRNAADIVWELLGGRPDADRYSRRVHTVEMDVRELGKLIAMATASSPANECSNAERTQYELTLAQQQSKIADLTANIEQMENANLRTAPYIEENLATIERQKEKIAELDRKKDTALREEHRLGTDLTILRGQSTVDKHNLEQAQSKIAELHTRIAELTKVPVVNGKVPGQVNFEAYEAHLRASMTPGIDIRVLVAGAYDAGAVAVIRVFGNGAAALQRVRDTMLSDKLHTSGMGIHGMVEKGFMRTLIDEELAALAPAKSPATP